MMCAWSAGPEHNNAGVGYGAVAALNNKNKQIGYKT
jgi:hypothetical protein